MAGRGMVIDLAELERFIETLQRFDAALEESSNKITSHFSTLGGVWRDQQYENFASGWDEAMHAIDNYVAESPRYVHHLKTKSGQVRRYLGQ